MRSSFLRGLSGLALLAAVASPAWPQDVRVNDRTGDPAATLQYTPALAALGDTVLVAWGHKVTGLQHTLRCAMSFDAGATFTSLGAPPLPAGWSWFLDGKVAADPADGAFYFAGRTVGVPATTGAPGGVFVVRGKPAAGATMAWDSPVRVDFLQSSPNFFTADGELLDLAVRESDGTALLTYATFNDSPDSLRFRWSQDNGVTWTATADVAIDPLSFMVNPRLAVTADGTVQVGWLTADATGNTVRATRTADLSTFAPLEAVASPYVNWASAPPRASFARPGMALASDPVFHAGRPSQVMLWSSGFDASTTPLPPLDTATRRAEIEAGDTTSAATTFSLDEVLEGALGTSADLDFWKFSGTAGTPMVFVADSGVSVVPAAPYTYLNLSVVGPDGRSWLASLEGLVQEDVSSFRLAFTAPVSGDYYLRIFSESGLTNGYRIRTAKDTRPITLGRDASDVFLTDFHAGPGWSAGHVDVSGTQIPSGYHETCPTLLYANDGQVWIGTYDWQETPATARSRYRILRYDLDLDFLDTAIASSAVCDWMNAAHSGTRYVFALGRTSAMARGRNRMYVAWTDGREGDSDIRLRSVRTDLSVVNCPPAAVSVHRGAEVLLPLTVHNHSPLFSNSVVVTNTAARSWPFAGISAVSVPASGNAVTTLIVQVPDTAAAGIVLIDRTLPDGTICTSKIEVSSSTAVGDATALAFGFEEIRPNPAAGPAHLAWSLPRAGRVTLEILDASGRRVREVASGRFGAGRHEQLWDGTDESGRAVGAGLYWVRLRSEAGTRTQRFVRLR